MPMQTITSAFARSLSAVVRMVSMSASEIEEGRCTHPRKSLPAPSPDRSRALAAWAFSFISGVRTTPVLEMSNFSVFIVI